MQQDERLMRKLTENKGWAQDLIANKMVKIKVRAVALDFEISKWIDKNLAALRDCYIVAQEPNF
jgi:hypothetical protein